MDKNNQSTKYEIVELADSFQKICDGYSSVLTSTNGLGIPDDFNKVSTNLLKLINVKTSLLVTEILVIEPLA